MQLPSLSCLILRSIFILAISPIFAQSTVVSLSVNAQFDKNEATTLQPFTILHEKNQAALRVAPNAQFLTLDPGVLANINRERPELLIVKLPYKGTQVQVKLARTQVTTDDFTVITEKNNTLPGFCGR
jgi:hypothetical protein